MEVSVLVRQLVDIGLATVYRVLTQFEAADARRCFPCWDEPAIKATFALTVTAPKNRTVHSNMPLVGFGPGSSSKSLLCLFLPWQQSLVSFSYVPATTS